MSILCKNCKHCKTKTCGFASYRAYCDILPKDKRGIRLEKKQVNPRCPLKENKEFLKIAKEMKKRGETLICLDIGEPAPNFSPKRKEN